MSSYKKLTVEFKQHINDLFNANGFECRKLFYGNEIFYCLIDILQCLNYDVANVGNILSKINEYDKFTIEELQDKYYSPLTFEINNELISSQNQDELKYVYINKTTLFELVGSFKNLEAKSFKDFVYKKLLLSLDNIYKKIVKKKEEEIMEMQKRFIEYENELLELQRSTTDQLYRTGLLVENNRMLRYTEALENNYLYNNAERIKYNKKRMLVEALILTTTSLISFLYWKKK